MIKSKNFAFISHVKWNNKDNIITSIETIEKIISNREIENIGNKIRTFTEDLFINELNIDEHGLGGNIKELRRITRLETPINHALSFINVKGNSQSHSKFSNTAVYNTDFTYYDALSMIRSVWIFMKWIMVYNKQVEQHELSEIRWSDDAYGSHKTLVSKNKTEIGNDSKELEIGKFTIMEMFTIDKHIYNIPSYQREYIWSISVFGNYVQDIIARIGDASTHYLGSIAVAKKDDDGILKIIDGQQRITSSLIIARVIMDVFKNKNISLPEELESLSTKGLHNVYKNLGVTSSQKAVAQVLGRGLAKKGLVKYTHAADANYNYVWNILQDFDEDELLEFYLTFAKNIQVSLVQFNIDLSNEMDIFQKMNSTGTALSEWDLIKNYLFSRYEWTSSTTADEKLINDYIMTELMLKVSIAQPNKGEESRNELLKKFITAYLRYKSVVINGTEMQGRQVYKTFVELFELEHPNKTNDKNEFYTWIDDISKYLTLFLELQIQYSKLSSKLFAYENRLTIINKDDLKPIYFHLLGTWIKINDKQELVIDTKHFDKLTKLLEIYLTRINIAISFNSSQTKMFDAFLVGFIKSNADVNQMPEKLHQFLTNPEEANPAMPSYGEFAEKLATTSNIRPSFMRNMLVTLEKKISNFDNGIHMYSSSYEHIIAQRLKYEKYCQENKVSISKHEYNEKKVRWMNSLGNATILTTKENSKAGSKPFSEKLANVYSSSPLKLNNGDKTFSLTNYTEFDFSDIEKRGKIMANVIAPLYKDYDDFDSSVSFKNIEKYAEELNKNKVIKGIKIQADVKNSVISHDLDIFSYITYAKPSSGYDKENYEIYDKANAKSALIMYLLDGEGGPLIDAQLTSGERTKGWLTSGTLAFLRIATNKVNRGVLRDFDISNETIDELVDEIIDAGYGG